MIEVACCEATNLANQKKKGCSQKKQAKITSVASKSSTADTKCIDLLSLCTAPVGAALAAHAAVPPAAPNPFKISWHMISCSLTNVINNSLRNSLRIFAPKGWVTMKPAQHSRTSSAEVEYTWSGTVIRWYYRSSNSQATDTSCHVNKFCEFLLWLGVAFACVQAAFCRIPL
jgi:hypothetical protein